ncbi:AEL083Wp [Eremothecium gossypii ATCC 10895]|uniref:AEL083Wp n=1 Tax=Eremothecium gossypii (strain ATCC 10895 / CBS 109.51 / FGSC 9923 / NRRL Y-1056) TaxID=284811 RepID=Q757U5_EREGS|nr:AEL083Wp [Eremothecium gossypii ATCC 10895]AAS52602.1 AEL083Wp [Eremothecium gossypii ATCC 10895]AEY96904.1 FAEL083Wp [Eremothecium gossypii FDAG1]
MALFKFDEEISRRTSNCSGAILLDEFEDSHSEPSHDVDSDDFGQHHEQDLPWYKNLMSLNPTATAPKDFVSSPLVHSSISAREPAYTPARSRRRSSLYNKFAVSTPPNTTRFPVSVDAEAFLDPTLPEGMSPSFQKRQTPRKLEDFKPVRVLGRGAYGKVLLVKDQLTSKLFAMKQLKKAEIVVTAPEEESTDGEDAVLLPAVVEKRVERTFAERTILSQLEHPNIVKLFYSFHDHHKLYLVLQYIPGGELFYHLKEQGTLDEVTVSFYAAEISCALKFLHSKGIVYRDLKPENCLLDDKGHLVLTDFGLSKRGVNQADSPLGGEQVEELYSIIGTPEYCAPEILCGQPYTQNCDWYSLGSLTYDMLIGKPPFTGANHKVILSKIKQDKGIKIPHYLSDGMKDYLNALLKKDIGKRWDVDRFWDKEGTKTKKKKAGQAKTSCYQSHFIFRKINWKLMENGDLQRTTYGPIIPVITDWELAENFDSEFTGMRLESEDIQENGIRIQNNRDGSSGGMRNDVFKGFSFVASTSYLDRYF